MEAGRERWRADVPEATASPPGRCPRGRLRAYVRARSPPPPGEPLPACKAAHRGMYSARSARPAPPIPAGTHAALYRRSRSEEHTSELQSRRDLVCRLLLEKKKKKKHNI